MRKPPKHEAEWPDWWKRLTMKWKFDLGLIIAFVSSLIVARCTVSWQADRTDSLEASLKYAEMVTTLFDHLNSCQAGIAALRGKSFDEKLGSAEATLIGCRGNLSKLRAGFNVLSKRLKTDGASEIYEKLTQFDLILLARIQEVQGFDGQDKLSFQNALADKMAELIQNGSSSVVDITKIKFLLNQ